MLASRQTVQELPVDFIPWPEVAAVFATLQDTLQVVEDQQTALALGGWLVPPVAVEVMRTSSMPASTILPPAASATSQENDLAIIGLFAPRLDTPLKIGYFRLFVVSYDHENCWRIVPCG